MSRVLSFRQHCAVLLLLAVSACGPSGYEPDSPTPSDETASPDPSGTPGAQDRDGDGALEGDDCNDADAAVYPGATESCDSIDNDCDQQVDEAGAAGERTFYLDQDGDAFGRATATIEACTAPAGYASGGSDCDDLDPTVHPGAAEVCDGVDNNCDGTTDGPDAGGATLYYLDQDLDGYGTSSSSTSACELPEGYAALGGDCDDSSPVVYPGATEQCDLLDNDCDGLRDEDLPLTRSYADADGDGYGDTGAPLDACFVPAGYATVPGDCDDLASDTHPGSEDSSCDGRDQDCDGLDYGGRCLDSDGDGFTPEDGDCDDARPDVYPGAVEIFDGVDQECDGLVDDGVVPVGAMIVTEIMANPAGEDALGEWFEVYNLSAYAVDLYLWALRDNNSSAETEIVIDQRLPVAPQGYAVLGNCGDPALNGGLTLDYAYYPCGSMGPSLFVLTNTPTSAKPEQIVLYDGPSGRQIDAVSYVDAPQEGLSRQLDADWFNATDNDANAAGIIWCHGPATPGRANVPCPSGRQETRAQGG